MQCVCCFNILTWSFRSYIIKLLWIPKLLNAFNINFHLVYDIQLFVRTLLVMLFSKGNYFVITKFSTKYAQQMSRLKMSYKGLSKEIFIAVNYYYRIIIITLFIEAVLPDVVAYENLGSIHSTWRTTVARTKTLSEIYRFHKSQSEAKENTFLTTPSQIKHTDSFSTLARGKDL